MNVLNSLNMEDVVIIGSGHAGVEAAHIASKLGLKTTLVTFNLNDIAQLPCNVSIGGSAKGIVVKELFALGGLMPLAADETQLQTKILNQSKGPAVRALRAQVDKIKYPEWIKNYILKSNIKLIFGEVKSLIFNNDRASGVILSNNKKLNSKYVIICAGTFLRSKIMQGKDVKEEGPDGKKSSVKFSKQLEERGIKILRLKTGTPPRIKTNTIDFSKLTIESGSEVEIFFTEKKFIKKQYQNVPAFLTYTNDKTHKIIEKNIKESYLFSEEIKGAGPRYCPSIEDKVKRFSDKERHQIFLEIESEHLETTYLSGLSSSLSKKTQEKFIHTIRGLENSKIEKYAYAIEYDAIDPTQLKQTLESKKIKNLFFAGQINGTSGYEEAAAQGLWAAVNVSNKIKDKEEFILGRDESYIGVMIDDITTKGIVEPYRLLSSRSEYRLLLRTDNAVKRLYKRAFENNLISLERFSELRKKFNIIKLLENDFNKIRFKLNNSLFLDILNKKNIKINMNSIPALEIIKRPEFNFYELRELLIKDLPIIKTLSNDDINFLFIKIKFRGYIEKQEREVKKYKRLHNLKLSFTIDYNKIPNLAIEAREKLNLFKPNSVHQASKIQGVNPSDIMCIIQYINKNNN